MKIPVQVARNLLVISGLALLLVGCGATKTINSAVAVGKSDELAAIALQLHFKQNKTPEALKLLQKATKAAPKRKEILWLYFELCAQVLDCRTEPLEAQLLKLDPSNGAIQLGALARAQRERDPAAEAAVLDAIGRSQGFEIYWNSLISKLARAAGQVNERTQPVTRSLNEITDWYSTLASASFGPLLQACSAERTAADSGINGRCIRIVGLLLQSDTYIAESVALSIAQRVYPDEQAQKVAERGVVSKYRRETASEIINAQLDRERVSVQLIELMAKVPREQDVFLAVVRWGGQSTVPLEP